MPAAAPDRPASDEDLMQAYAGGDAAAFDALYARHKGGVYRYLLRHCGTAASADELFQDVWMNVIRARASYAPSARFTTWVYRIAHNRLVDHWRANATRPALPVAAMHDDEDADDPLDDVPGRRGDEPETRVASGELGARIRMALAALPPAQRDAFLLHQEAGLELAAIAELTGEGTETIKSRIRYALGKLRSALGDIAQDFQ
jgi:RNA polymerase sigma-70 factor (ECF subfamily)